MRMRKTLLNQEGMGYYKVVLLLTIFMTTNVCKVMSVAGNEGCDPNDLRALNDFKAGITFDDSQRLKTWIGVNCCIWRGIYCDEKTGRVTKIYLPGSVDDFGPVTMKGELSPSLHLLSSLRELNLGGLSQLSGQIPPLIGDLKDLRFFDLSRNNLSGPIPESIGKLSKLEKMFLSVNHFSGPLPSSIRNLTSLDTLSLASNQLSGPIPEYIGNFTSLISLILQSNNFSGHIPESIENLINLQYLYLGNNFLTGQIPEILGKLQQLKELDLSGNMLEGGIPHSIGDLKFVTNIQLGKNLLGGTIPSSIAYLESLETFSIRVNQIEGSIPDIIGNLSSLRRLDLGWNRFSGRLPGSISRIPYLTMLSIKHNMIEGPLPQEMSSIITLRELFLSFNPLNLSFIPNWLIDLHLISVELAGCGIQGNLPDYMKTAADRWEKLDLSANNLTGTLPDWLGNFKLNFLNLSHNLLSSEIPITFKNLRNMRDLDLHSNKLSGSLAPVLQIAKQPPLNLLQTIDLSDNSFSGDIQDMGKIDTHQQIKLINLSHNHIQGALPTSVGNLRRLSLLDLCYNHFNSGLPKSLENIENLDTLMLQNNQFNGTIPPAFLNMKHLRELNLSNNLLSGQIPYGKPLVDFPPSSYSGNKGLCGVPLGPCSSPPPA